jgi:hypothetical protein
MALKDERRPVGDHLLSHEVDMAAVEADRPTPRPVAPSSAHRTDCDRVILFRVLLI